MSHVLANIDFQICGSPFFPKYERSFGVLTWCLRFCSWHPQWPDLALPDPLTDPLPDPLTDSLPDPLPHPLPDPLTDSLPDSLTDPLPDLPPGLASPESGGTLGGRLNFAIKTNVFLTNIQEKLL